MVGMCRKALCRDGNDCVVLVVVGVVLVLDQFYYQL